MTNAPNLYVDADFGPDVETAERAAATWDPAGVAVRVTVVPHRELVQMTGWHEPNTIYLVATHRLDESDCPHLDETIALPGVTKAAGGSAVSCIDVDYIRDTKTPEGAWVMQRAMAHEMGHALIGPAHFGDGLMENSYTGATSPTCEDFAALVRSLPGTFTPEKCR